MIGSDLTLSPFGAEVLAHLDAQLRSARGLLDAVLRQGRAIRVPDVDAVLTGLAEIEAEMERRAGLEQDRARLLGRAGETLGIAAHMVTLDAMSTLLSPGEAQAARASSAELRGLLEEIGREHRANRALMRQELAFLDHLMRTLGAGGSDSGTYEADRRVHTTPSTPSAATLRVLDLEA
jgi:hypothetical protein